LPSVKAGELFVAKIGSVRTKIVPKVFAATSEYHRVKGADVGSHHRGRRRALERGDAADDLLGRQWRCPASGESIRVDRIHDEVQARIHEQVGHVLVLDQPDVAADDSQRHVVALAIEPLPHDADDLAGADVECFERDVVSGVGCQRLGQQAFVAVLVDVVAEDETAERRVDDTGPGPMVSGAARKSVCACSPASGAMRITPERHRDPDSDLFVVHGIPPRSRCRLSSAAGIRGSSAAQKSLG
jgi:hypothetical protein